MTIQIMKSAYEMEYYIKREEKKGKNTNKNSRSLGYHPIRTSSKRFNRTICKKVTQRQRNTETDRERETRERRAAEKYEKLHGPNPPDLPYSRSHAHGSPITATRHESRLPPHASHSYSAVMEFLIRPSGVSFST